MIITIIILLIILYITIVTGAIIYVCGKPLSNDKFDKYAKEINLHSIARLNTIDKTIIMLPNTDNFITTFPLLPLCPFKYYLDNHGPVWRWSRTAKEIDDLYVILNT